MTTTSTETTFAGPYAAALKQLSDLIEWLWAEHDKSFVKAGDDKVYAFGGNGYILVFDESRLDGLVELITPAGAVTIKATSNGREVAGPAGTDEKGTKAILDQGINGIRAYYEDRYWSTPKTS